MNIAYANPQVTFCKAVNYEEVNRLLKTESRRWRLEHLAAKATII